MDLRDAGVNRSQDAKVMCRHQPSAWPHFQVPNKVRWMRREMMAALSNNFSE